MFNLTQIKGLLCWKWRNSRNYLICHKTIDPLKLTSDKLKRQARDNMKNIKRILEKFDSWKYDIYESNKSDWTKQDDKDVNEIEKLLEQQASKQKG